MKIPLILLVKVNFAYFLSLGSFCLVSGAARRLDGVSPGVRLLLLLAWYSIPQLTSFCPSLDRVAVLRWSLSSHTGRCEHGVCPFQSKSARQGASGSNLWFLQFCRQACVPNAGLLLLWREAVSLGRSLRSAGIIGTSLLVTYINYQFKLYLVLYLTHLNNHLWNFGRNLCAVLGKLFSQKEPQFLYYDVTERGVGKPLGKQQLEFQHRGSVFVGPYSHSFALETGSHP